MHTQTFLKNCIKGENSKKKNENMQTHIHNIYDTCISTHNKVCRHRTRMVIACYMMPTLTPYPYPTTNPNRVLYGDHCPKFLKRMNLKAKPGNADSVCLCQGKDSDKSRKKDSRLGLSASISL